MMSTAAPSDLASFVISAHDIALAATEGSDFSSSQRKLLVAVLKEHRTLVGAFPAADPISVFYLLPKAHDAAISPLALQLAGYGTLLTVAGKILDDVQDADFSKGALQGVSAPVALNTGLTLLMLALESLQNAMRLETNPSLRARYVDVLAAGMLDGLSGQHRDVEGLPQDAGLEDCLAVARAKGGCFVIFLESAALCAGCTEEDVARYRDSAINLALLRQIVDDVRDVFGKYASPDLSSGKLTTIVAYFRQIASSAQIEEFDSACGRLPETLPAIRKLLYSSGAVRLCAEKVEELRHTIHREVSQTANQSASQRTWLQVIDALAGTMYSLPPLSDSAHLFEPQGAWHDTVRNSAREMIGHLKAFSPPAPPRIIPWNRREWMYDLMQRCIYYSDVSGQPEEILPAQQEMLGLHDPAEVRRLLEATAPATMAHEYFHFWRHQSGSYCGDWWFEEWAASRLVVAYVQRYRPSLAPALKGVAERILESASLSEAGKAVLEHYFATGYRPGDGKESYGVSVSDLVAIQVASTLRLLEQELSLETEIRQLLDPR